MKTRTSPSPAWTTFNGNSTTNTVHMPRSATVIGMVPMRPNSLNVSRDKNNNSTQQFIREALHAWRAKARCNVVPAERLRDLFEELNFSPTERQLNEMLQTAKLFARRGSGLDGRNRHIHGLTFGEFCVLAADLKRFRAQIVTRCHDNTCSSSLPLQTSKSRSTAKASKNLDKCQHASPTKDSSSKTATFDSNAPEVFLGGSCNPTTWRADVAIPTLNELGISFYNPQVSDWTPDLIELEHRAKEKARVLFFVMDSETRGSAGAIEVAHIAGQNSKHLVLVLHPYKPDQCILNEPISPQEFIDLRRNQQLLEDLLTRRGLPILDSIPSGLQRTRALLTGSAGRTPPYNIASRLISVRRAFDRVLSDQMLDDKINIAQCQCALSFLGYAQNLLSADNLKSIVESHRESDSAAKNERSMKSRKGSCELYITFDEFCMLTSYLTILQQEIHDSGCISPIKGTNLPPPPIFLTNAPEWIHNQSSFTNGVITSNSSYAKQIFRTNSCKSVPDDRFTINNSPSSNIGVNLEFYRNRDSGTSSPQPHESKNVHARIRNIIKKSKISVSLDHGDESDSNDSVFSSGSSTESNADDHHHTSGLEIRDLYLGGSCMIRTNWRKDIVMPMLNQRGITYHLPMLQESISSAMYQYQESIKSGKLQIGGGVTPKKRNKKFVENADKFGDDVASSSTPNGKNKKIEDEAVLTAQRRPMFNPALLEASRVLLFIITNETRSLAPMTLAAHYIGLGYNVVLCVQMLPEFCVIGNDRLTPAAIKDYNRGRSYLIDLAKREGVPVFSDIKQTVECAIEKIKSSNSRKSI